jgi:3-oxoacyl-[acyl-carrier-protein] synthase III
MKHTNGDSAYLHQTHSWTQLGLANLVNIPYLIGRYGVVTIDTEKTILVGGQYVMATLSVPQPTATFDRLPPLDFQNGFAPGSEKLVRLGNIAVVQAGWGYQLDTDSILQQYRGNGYDIEKITESMLQTGFTHGYYYPLSRSTFDDETQAWHIKCAANLAERVARERNWDSIDILILGSSTTYRESLQGLVQELAQRGITVGEAQIYVQACNSALAGINDLCRMPEYHGKRAVVIGMESLTGGDVYDFERPNTIRIFGNGGGAVAFIPGVEIQHINGRTIAEYDYQGVITGPQACPVSTITDRIEPPAWYETVGDYTDGKLVASKDGIFIEIPPSEDSKLRMNGMSTLAYFAKRVPPLALDVVNTYYTEHAEQYGNLQNPLSHQPSLPVITFVNNDLMKAQLADVGIDTRNARKLARNGTLQEIRAAMAARGHDHDPVQIPWVMEGTGFNNISAGTSVITLVKMIEESMIEPNVPLPVFGFGIGSVIQADIWRFTV